MARRESRDIYVGGGGGSGVASMGVLMRRCDPTADVFGWWRKGGTGGLRGWSWLSYLGTRS